MCLRRRNKSHATRKIKGYDRLCKIWLMPICALIEDKNEMHINYISNKENNNNLQYKKIGNRIK